jgi:tetratricopeptide (TPR) repeat protein
MRQMTLRATLEWSYTLLSGPEQRLFERLSAFAGGWTLEAAETVGSGDDLQARDVLDLLEGLVDKSMVVTEPPGDGSVRYRLLETLRQYGHERLESRGEVEATRSRYADYFAGLAEEAAPHLRGGAHFEAWLKRLTPEISNLLAALRWCADCAQVERGLRLGGSAWRFVYVRGASQGHRLGRPIEDAGGGLTPEEREWLDLLLQLTGPPGRTVARALALGAAGALLLQAGDYPTAETVFEESLAIRRELGDAAGIVTCRRNLAAVAAARGDNGTALQIFEESLAFARAYGDRLAEAGIQRTLGRVFAELGEYATARTRLTEAMQAYAS